MHSCDLQQLLWPPAPAQGWHLRLCLCPSCCSGILNLLHRGGNSWPEILIMRMFLTSNSMSLNEIGLSRLSASSVFHLVSSLWPSCLFSSEFSIVHSRSFLRTLLPLSDLSPLHPSLSFIPNIIDRLSFDFFDPRRSVCSSSYDYFLVPLLSLSLLSSQLSTFFWKKEAD